ncbi:ankyrin repeat domain-containing protein 50-like [Pecten maximus]|uniref:ankyrin repeat domain-containing protein 50-like n=1 Tax=Pecten maximus TaxID=6579 RepID=UPI001458574D|nr:ankyrin repeat domain-containing protein 50-like [Pecten maximus]
MANSLLKSKRFFCREWAFSKINHCLENRPSSKTCGALIMGGPGCGKTALCCELVWPTASQGKQKVLNKRILSFHFCQAHDIGSLSLASFICDLVKQLQESNLISGYRELVSSTEIQQLISPTECEKNPDVAFQKAVLEPLSSLQSPKQTLFMLVDSVDESYLTCTSDRTTGSKTIAELLANHHTDFPKWLLLVCSSRKQSKSVTRLFTGFRKISLDDLRKSHVVRDVQQYILCRLDQEEELRQHLSRDTAEMLNQLHIKSNGCFLYLEKVLDGVAENFIMLREIREIPGTLNGLYLWLCQRLFVRKQFTKIQPILNVILASRTPLSESELFQCVRTKNTTLTEKEFLGRLKLLSKILIEGQNHCKILFHHSFAEWLLDVKHCTQKYLCLAADGHGMLAMHSMVNGPKLTALQVQDFAGHLVKANLQDPLQHHHLVQILLLSEANVEDSLSAGVPKEQKVTKLLLDAGAKPPEDSEEAQTASLHASMIEEAEAEPKLPMELDIPVNQIDSNGRTLLHTSAHQGNLELVNFILSKSVELEVVDKNGQTALNLAARQGHPEVVAAILKAGAQVDHADGDGWTPLRSAAWGGNTEVVSLLLSANADVNHADADQRTALRAAAWGGHEEIVLKLLKHNADVNKADNEGRTALIAAAYMGHAEIVNHLLKYDADINHEDCDGRTALSVAALCIPASQGHEDVVSILLEQGAEVNHQDKDGMTPLLVAACEGHMDVCELLLDSDADCDHTDTKGRTPLLAAASMGHSKIVNQLLFWGCAVDTIDSEGRIVLSIAAAQGNVDIVQQLLDRGLDEMHKDNAGWSPLHMAAYEGHVGVCETLINHCARVNETDNDGRHPLILAAQEGHLGVVTCVVQHGSATDHRSHDGKTAFRVAAFEGHKEVARYLISMGTNISYKDADGRSTLYILALENKVDMVAFILEMGVEVECTDLEGRTALHVAAWQGHFEVVELLLRYNANVNAVDNDQRTALQSAAWQGHDNIVQLLLERGASVDHTCNQGATALCIAAQEGHETVVKVLLTYKANPNHADQFGRTPVRVSLKSGHSKVCKILEEFGAVLPNSSKSRSSSSASSNDARPSCVTGPVNGVGVVVNGNQLNSSPSDSPDSTFDRRKSYASNNSSKSSSNLTSSTNQSSQSGATTTTNGDCLTFTQQLQQCSMARHRTRPISRVLSPVSEPQSPVQSPPMSPNTEVQKIVGNEQKLSPVTERNFNILGPSPVKFPNCKHKEIKATINIITNPNADLSEEPVWLVNHAHFQNNLEKLRLKQNAMTCDQPIMGQSALEMRSPDTKPKRNGIVTNPKIKGVNGQFKKVLERNDKIINGTNGSLINNEHNVPSNNYKGPPRPNGLPLKKETPL